MDRQDGFRRLADVVNLQDRVAAAEQVVAAADDKITKAKARVADAEASKAKAQASLDSLNDRLATAREAAAEIPAEMVGDLAAQVGSKRAARARYITALTIEGDDTEHIAAAAAAAGVVSAKAGVATGDVEAKGAG